MIYLRNITKIFILFLMINSVPALHNISEDDEKSDITFNIFRLNENLRTSSILKYAKCANLETGYSTEDLVSSAIKLDCNSNKDEVSFCKCVNLIAGSNVNIQDITKKIDKKYREFLELNDEEIVKDIVYENLGLEYIKLKRFSSKVNSPEICSPAADNDIHSNLKDLPKEELSSQQYEIFEFEGIENDFFNIESKEETYQRLVSEKIIIELLFSL